MRGWIWVFPHQFEEMRDCANSAKINMCMKNDEKKKKERKGKQTTYFNISKL